MSKTTETTLVLLEKLHEIVQVGVIDVVALRGAFGPNVSDFQFNMALRQARLSLRAEGYWTKMDRRNPGHLIIATAQDAAEKALNTSRHKVVRVARERLTLIRDAQRHHGMDEESRQRIRTEELLYGRTLQLMEQALLRSQRKKPEGLE